MPLSGFVGSALHVRVMGESRGCVVLMFCSCSCELRDCVEYSALFVWPVYLLCSANFQFASVAVCCYWALSTRGLGQLKFDIGFY